MKSRASGIAERSLGSMKGWAKGFYLSRAWENTRAAYLMSQDYICERCGEPAKVAHHKRYLTRENVNDAGITLSWDNLEALCQDCHNKEHHRRKTRLRYRFDAYGRIVPPLSRKIIKGEKYRGGYPKNTLRARVCVV